MTTGNLIETTLIPDVLSIPIEAVDNVDGVPFVYARRGSAIVRQEVITGAMNDEAVVVV